MVRDIEWIDREYNQEKWLDILSEARRLTTEGEHSMPRLLALLELYQRTSWAKACPESSTLDASSFGKLVKVPFAVAFEGFAGLVTRMVCNLCTTETGCVVELGSGYGRFLFRTWLSGGPSKAPYFALEYAESGRDCTTLLGDLEPTMDISAYSFNLYEPDYSFLPHGLKHAVIFSCQSIEQVPDLPPESLTGLLDIAEEVSCLHFEPAGWQMRSDSSPRHESASGEAYAEENDYNRNLWPLLGNLESDGLIHINRKEVDVFGVVPANCVSIVGWSKNRQGVS